MNGMVSPYPRLCAAQRPIRHRRALHRTPSGHRALALPRGAGARRHGSAPYRRRIRGRRARARDAAVPGGLGPAAGGVAVDRLAGQLLDGLGLRRHRGRVPRRDGDAVHHAGAVRAPGSPLAAAATRRRARAARGRARAHLRIYGDRRAHRIRVLVRGYSGAGPRARPALMRRRFLDYYRQFEELGPEEVSRELRSRRDAERAVVGVPTLDLSVAGWHEPPHPEVVNAATFALRRAVNAYPDASELQDAIARSHGVDASRVVVGHGAGELLRAILRMVAPDGDVLVAWPGWGPLPRLVHEAGATPVPVALDELDGMASRRPHALVVGRPADPTGAVAEVADLTGDHWLILDEALAGFLDDAPLLGHPRVIHVRSFSKAHAMAGFRVGYAIVPEGTPTDPLMPVHGVGAAALAGAQWAVEKGAPSAAARRALCARERSRLAAGPFPVAPGAGPYAWLETRGRPLAEELAARRIFVAPGSAWGDDAHVRVTLRDAASTHRLLEALRELASGLGEASRA